MSGVFSFTKKTDAMEINTNELDFITDKLTAALIRPLEERVAQLEEQNRLLTERVQQGNEAMALQRMALAAKDMEIQRLAAELQQAREQRQQQELNVWCCQQYIPLSKPATQAYVVSLADNHDRAFLAHFFMHTLPKDAPRKLTEEVTQLTQLQAETPKVVHVTGNYNDVHDNGHVGMNNPNP